jgi:uncharacterized protein (TIGR02677 family)
MTLTPGLMRTAMSVLTRGEVAPHTPGDGAAGDGTPVTRLGAQPVLRYATDEGHAPLYRRLMRVLFLEHQGFGLRLRPGQVADRLREQFGLQLEPDQLQQRLDRLAEWGALDREHDAALATTAAEWRRSRYTYDVTPAGRLAEHLLAQLDELGRDHGVLDGQRIPAIRDALNRLADGLAGPEPDGRELRSLLEQVLVEVEALHAGALAFMKRLGALIRRADEVSEEEFERSKGALIDHLQGFRRDRRRWSDEVLAALDRVEAADATRLVDLIVASEDFVALPGGAGIEEQRGRRHEELLRQWAGVRTWFLGEGHSASPWRTLNESVVEAIRAVLEIAERLIERRTQRVDRAHVYVRLAAQAAAAAPGDGCAWVLAALGIGQPRHVGVPEHDPDQVADRGRTSWRDAPPAPVVAHLRRPGARTPGTGRGARVPDLADARARLAERRRRERAELDAMLARFAGRRETRLSDLERLDERSFAHLLAWIGRAYEAPAGTGGARRAPSSDGRAEILLRPPGDGRRATLRAPHGRLDAPDFAVEVLLR